MSYEAPLACLSLGLLAGSHCLLMCGGVAGITAPPPSLPARSRLWLRALVHGGRFATYALLGGFAALWGAASVEVVPELRLVLRLLAALLVALTGLKLLGVALPGASALGARYGGWLQKGLRTLLPADTPKRAWQIGMLWGALPCGLTLSAVLLSAASERPEIAALSMLAFGLGTLPWLLSLDALWAAARRWLQAARAQKLLGAALLLAALLASAQQLRAHSQRDACCHSEAPAAH